MSDDANTKTPLVISLLLVLAGLVLGVRDGFWTGSVLGGIVAGAGLVPACYAAWLGTQKSTQGSLIGALGMIVASLGVGGVLLVLGVIDSLRS